MRRALAALVVVALVLPAAARADGDPASDVLLTQDSFLPYSPPQDKLKTALEDVLAQAKDAGSPMKVALIGSDRDLGSYPNLFNSPQQYADLLTQELATLNPHGDPVKAVHLLVVMPGGFGGNNLGEQVDDALGPIAIESQAGSDGLAKAALEAVARLATVNGSPVEVPPEADAELSANSAGGGGRGGTSPLVFALPAVMLFAGLFVAGRITRKRATGDSD